ncbi:MAG: hypothetical protein N4P90_02225 [Candidatus Lightella neohaematopini]|nr:hypothetical protein [Candidatus Lightella neohaematopini]
MTINKLKINYNKQTIEKHTSNHKNVYVTINFMEILKYINQLIKLLNKYTLLVKEE